MVLVTPPVFFTLSYFVIGHLNAKLSKVPPHLDEKKQLIYLGQFISLLHSTLSFTFSFLIYLMEGGVDYEAPMNEYHRWLLGHTMGYMTYDLLKSEYLGLYYLSLRLHHLFSCIVLYFVYISGENGSAAVRNV